MLFHPALTRPCAALLLVLALALPAHAQGKLVTSLDPRHIVLNDISIRQLAMAYGFVLSQAWSLDAIGKTYPDMAYEANALRNAFEVRYGFPTQRLAWALHGALRPGALQQLVSQLERQFSDPLGQQSPADLRKFLDEVRARIGGNMNPEILRTLLWVQYAERPDLEMATWSGEFSSRGHPKSLGLSVSLSFPLSWMQDEGNRPHIVQMWTSQGGTGDMSILLQVRTFNERVTADDIDAFVAAGDWTDMLPDGFRLREGKAVTLDRQPGLYMVSEGESAVLDQKIANRVAGYMLFLEGHIVMLQCMISRDARDEFSFHEARFERLRELCRRVALSMSFPDTWR
ncbi:hypothetical protein [Oceanicella actignis]|uniref:hypothetical protein n=1 Tax=Oceanicella actignis TaxID=1189325 RepID=UPI0011E8456B|nr:hypothetical protein [Oceanicella actignis]TYO84654.1 hypothetical protein LY05_02920 [Oceanicella actignis]